MRRPALALVLLAGCATALPAPVLRDGRDLDAYVGKVVTRVCVQTRSKQPAMCGVDVDGDYALSDRLVRATGVLGRRVIPRRDEPTQVATRGPGTYYTLVDATTHQLARPISEP